MDKLENIDHKRLEKALGQIHGLRAAITALVITPPKPSLLLEHLEQSALAAQARALPVAVSDAFLDGMDAVLEPLQTAAQRAVQQK